MTPSFPHPNQGTVLWDTAHTPSGSRLRGFHPLWRAVPGHFGFAGEERRPAHNTTSPMGFPTRFGLDYSPFGRPYSGNPVLVSFPPPTKMLPFGGFPLPAGSTADPPKEPAVGGPIRGSPVLGLHAPTRGSIAACRALRRRSSRAIHQTAWHVGLEQCLFSGEPFRCEGLCKASS